MNEWKIENAYEPEQKEIQPGESDMRLGTLNRLNCIATSLMLFTRKICRNECL